MTGRIFGLTIPFAGLLGIEAIEQSPGRVQTRLTIRPELTNSWGAAHGGVIMSLLDLTLGMAARSLDQRANGAVTVELKANFIGTAQGRISAEGRALQSGKSLIFSEGEVRNEAGIVVANAMGTFKLYRGENV